MFLRAWIVCWSLLFGQGAVAAQTIMVYHEASCPSVDATRMPRVKRVVAEERGWIPAADCHPEARVRYLGVGPSSFSFAGSDSSSGSDAKTVKVQGHWRGSTWVGEHWRSAPNSQER